MERRNVRRVVGQIGSVVPLRHASRVGLLVSWMGAALATGCVFGRTGQSDLRLLDGGTASEGSRVSSAETWPRQGKASESEEAGSGDSVLLARQKRAETAFFGFANADEDALAYAEFPGTDVDTDTDIDLEMAQALPMTRQDSGADGKSNTGSYTALRRSRNPKKSEPLVAVDGLIWPVLGSISSPFGMRRGRLHAGIDIRANRGTPVLASRSGQILISSRRRAYGNVVVVGHDSNVQTLYAHLIKMIVRSGQYVDQGDVIGYVGRTGRATGYHLHFETRVNGGVPQDPIRSLPDAPKVHASLN